MAYLSIMLGFSNKYNGTSENNQDLADVLEKSWTFYMVFYIMAVIKG